MKKKRGQVKESKRYIPIEERSRVPVLNVCDKSVTVLPIVQIHRILSKILFYNRC